MRPFTLAFVNRCSVHTRAVNKPFTSVTISSRSTRQASPQRVAFLIDGDGCCCSCAGQWPLLASILIPSSSAHPSPFVFTARCYASAVLAMALCLSVCPSQVGVLLKRLNVGSHKLITPHDSAGNLVFWCQRSPRNSTGVTPYEGAECRWGGSKSATFDQ